MTIDAVAKAMGISKGGVQYCFGSKDALIDAMFDRWGSAYETLFTAIAGDEPSPQTAVRGAYAGHPQFGSDFQRQGRRVDGNADSNAGASGEHARMVSQPHRRFGFDDRRRQARARRFSPPKAPLCCVTLV